MSVRLSLNVDFDCFVAPVESMSNPGGEVLKVQTELDEHVSEDVLLFKVIGWTKEAPAISHYADRPPKA